MSWRHGVCSCCGGVVYLNCNEAAHVVVQAVGVTACAPLSRTITDLPCSGGGLVNKNHVFSIVGIPNGTFTVPRVSIAGGCCSYSGLVGSSFQNSCTNVPPPGTPIGCEPTVCNTDILRAAIGVDICNNTNNLTVTLNSLVKAEQEFYCCVGSARADWTTTKYSLVNSAATVQGMIALTAAQKDDFLHGMPSPSIPLFKNPAGGCWTFLAGPPSLVINGSGMNSGGSVIITLAP